MKLLISTLIILLTAAIYFGYKYWCNFKRQVDDETLKNRISFALTAKVDLISDPNYNQALFPHTKLFLNKLASRAFICNQTAVRPGSGIVSGEFVLVSTESKALKQFFIRNFTDFKTMYFECLGFKSASLQLISLVENQLREFSLVQKCYFEFVLQTAVFCPWAFVETNRFIYEPFLCENLKVEGKMLKLRSVKELNIEEEIIIAFLDSGVEVRIGDKAAKIEVSEKNGVYTAKSGNKQVECKVEWR
ncbi:Hypothetical_protein [Hexamita inflata]|uniref:Hypothetical_protein n=1 Tax=Hexamita inflata TaxID=28002 RepID=A0AA86P6S3_9EUKA|nr:Hypothetical protein HINF_LOCUS20481 [Hexamita inflata]